ncbi:alpha/beta-hydrolase family protein [Intrasporangium sp. YIM S08009]|uniref:alpha/beta-hydrolase family protein n=1 Tax=Intrasporangium zincisolvens TaxID=3080018 RepID=UPI002B053B6C|nr:alpha/beta-hydrolase family protein [Intrasporangium sp. YIM S08009]
MAGLREPMMRTFEEIVSQAVTETGWSQPLATAAQTGLVMASASWPGTFEPSLVPRSTKDQAIITGLTTTLNYGLSTTTQDAIAAVAALVAPLLPGRDLGRKQALAILALDLLAVPVGYGLFRFVSRRPNEAILRGGIRQVGWRLMATGISGAVLGTARAGLIAVDDAVDANGRLARVPVAIPVGLAVGGAILRRQRRDVRDLPYTGQDEEGLERLRSAALGVVLAGGLTGAAYGEMWLAEQAGEALSERLPGPPALYRLSGHALCLTGVVAGVNVLWQRAMTKVEAGASGIDPFFDDPEGGRRWVEPTVSGSSESLVPWSSLGREGRRHTLLSVRTRPPADRPADVGDFTIPAVMGEPAVAEPVQVYVGLDTAPTAAERVELALAELDRTGAWDRSVLMLISPTGSGYVNYCASAAATYLTRGDIAMVTMQYSKRPSPLSLMKVKQAREQNRLLWLRLSARLRELNGGGPRVVLFGESLGAHTSQDVLLHWGTLGPQALGLERALWIGTPYGSGWMHQVTGEPRPDVDPSLVTVVNDFKQFTAMPAEQRSKLRYVLLTHDNDGVARFGLDLLTSRPAWLAPGRPLPQAVPGASPRGIPPRLRWRPVTTFFQTLVDMKNAQIPGAYKPWAHDYRPELTRFVSAVFDLPATDEQLDRIEQALEQRESLREQIFKG